MTGFLETPRERISHFRLPSIPFLPLSFPPLQPLGGGGGGGGAVSIDNIDQLKRIFQSSRSSRAMDTLPAPLPLPSLSLPVERRIRREKKQPHHFPIDSNQQENIRPNQERRRYAQVCLVTCVSFMINDRQLGS